MTEKTDLYDLIIIGGGPAGLAAALYACRAQISTLVVEKVCIGGQIILTDRVDNYPGFEGGVTGQELMDKMSRQALKFGAKISENTLISSIKKNRDVWELISDEGRKYSAYSIIIAAGASWKKLEVPGADRFEGRGISYCATCDGPLFKNKDVIVVGGGNAAVEEAVFLTKFVRRLTLVHRRAMLRAAKVLQDELLKNPKAELCLESVIIEISGDRFIDSVTTKNISSGELKKIPCQGIFVFIGHKPNSDLVKGLLDMDEYGYIVTDDAMAASKPGIFAAGDVRKTSLRQVVTAASDGARAAYGAEQFVRRLKGQEYK